MKLIIDIPKEVYKKAKETHDVMCDKVWLGIKYGTPLDDVKAEIKIFTITEKSEYDTGFNDAVLKCFNVLDNIGKAESEDK